VFTAGPEAIAWLSENYVVDHPSKLSAIAAIGVLGKLRTMSVSKPQEQPPEPPVENPTPPIDGAITQAQRIKIQNLTLAIYGDEAAKDQQDTWLKSLGYSSAMSCTSAQADARIAELTEAATVGAGVGDIPF